MIKKTFEPDGMLAWEAPVWLRDAIGSCELPPQSEDNDLSFDDELIYPEDHPLGFV